MPALIDIRRRIRSVKNTQQITKAMKMVSAAKLRRAQEAMFAARPYARKMMEVLNSMATRASPEAHPLLLERGGDRVLLVVVTGDKGLCGGFNANIIRAAITEIVSEGTFTKEGDVLIAFAQDEIVNKIKDAEDEVNTANSAMIAAQANLDIKLSERESEIAKADLDVTLAQLALKAWQEGEVVSKREKLKLESETAEMDYRRLADKYEESKKLAEQQFISKDELRSDEIRMVEAKARKDQARLDAQVYEDYEYKKDEAQKNSDVEQAVAERQRVEERHKAALQTARTEVASKEFQLRTRQERLAELRKQLEYCTVRAPSSGMAVYPTSLEEHRWSRGDRGDLQVGAEVSRNELLMLLPDTSEMTAEVKVNESLTGLIKVGLRVSVAPDALPDVTLEGEVTQIGVLAESGGWRDPNRRDYTVKVLLANTQGLGLDRKSTRLNSSHSRASRMPSSA